jgi:hypothetical protein
VKEIKFQCIPDSSRTLFEPNSSNSFTKYVLIVCDSDAARLLNELFQLVPSLQEKIRLSAEIKEEVILSNWAVLVNMEDVDVQDSLQGIIGSSANVKPPPMASSFNPGDYLFEEDEIIDPADFPDEKFCRSNMCNGNNSSSSNNKNDIYLIYPTGIRERGKVRRKTEHFDSKFIHF